jgi:hypothetical protein
MIPDESSPPLAVSVNYLELVKLKGRTLDVAYPARLDLYGKMTYIME